MGSLATLAATPLPTPDVRLPMRQVAQRYHVVVRTIERWALDPQLNFPKPIVVNEHKYFRLDMKSGKRCDRPRKTGGIARSPK